jgi:hypothetical protein
MRVPPPFQLSVAHFGVWNVAIALLCVMLMGVAALWCATADAVQCLIAAAVVLMICSAVLSLVRRHAISLRWDGQCWHLGPVETRGHEPLSGRVHVLVDAGVWLLLRFVPEGVARPWRWQWVPVQRAGHALAWHALRCAVFAHQPAVDSTALDAQRL